MIFYDGIIFNLQQSGGISVYFLEIMKRLDIDFNVRVYVNSNVMLKDAFSSGALRSNSFKFSYIPKFFLGFFRYFDVSVPKEALVFHSSYYRLPFFWQRKRLKIITTVHDFTYERYFTGLKMYIHSYQKRRSIINSDVIVCISESTKNDLLKYVPEAKYKEIHVIHNAVSSDFFPIQSNDFSRFNNKVLFVGARSGYKNFFELVKAVSELNKLKLSIVGGGALTPNEIKILQQYLPERFEYHKFLSNSDLNKMYNEAYCCVYPSLYEGFGIPVLEAMKSGCPVIASATSSIPEVASDAAILISEICSDKIIKSLNQIENVDCRKNMIERGFKNSLRFDWDTSYAKLKTIYLEKK